MEIHDSGRQLEPAGLTPSEDPWLNDGPSMAADDAGAAASAIGSAADGAVWQGPEQPGAGGGDGPDDVNPLDAMDVGA